MQRKKGSILLYQTFAFLMWKGYEKDTKLKAVELSKNECIFAWAVSILTIGCFLIHPISQSLLLSNVEILSFFWLRLFAKRRATFFKLPQERFYVLREIPPIKDHTKPKRDRRHIQEDWNNQPKPRPELLLSLELAHRYNSEKFGANSYENLRQRIVSGSPNKRRVFIADPKEIISAQGNKP